MRSVKDLIDLSGRKGLITGGAGHVGLAVGETLAELGADIAILDKNRDACLEQAERLEKIARGKVISFPCDLAVESDTRAAVRHLADELKGLDILVHCAALVAANPKEGWTVEFEKQTVSAWKDALAVDLIAGFVLAQEAAEFLKHSGNGSVIFFGSIYGLCGPDTRLYEGTDMSNPVGYGASKGGILQLTRYLATVLAPRVRVNAISPGGIFRNQPTPFLERYIARTPLRRMATEEDIKGAVAYLASDLSLYLTGQNLVVDGGFTVW